MVNLGCTMQFVKENQQMLLSRRYELPFEPIMLSLRLSYLNARKNKRS